MKKYTTRQPGDDKNTAVTVWKDIMKDFGSKESVAGVQGNVKSVFLIFGYILDIWRIMTIWRNECYYLEYRPQNFDTCPKGRPG